MKKIGLVFVFLSFIMLVSCQAKEEVIIITATPEPTLAPTSTSVPTLEPTPTPLGQIFRDDFNQELQPGWEWFNENSNLWKITQQGWLQIRGEDESLLNDHFQNNLLMQNAPVEGNFKIDVLVDANTVSNFQQASIFIYEDDGNYFSINRGYCDVCKTRGNGIYSDYMYKNKMISFNGRAINVNKVYLRIVVNRDKNELIAYYAIEPDKWNQLRKIPLKINISKVGLGVSNCESGGNSDNLLALYDYFEISVLE